MTSKLLRRAVIRANTTLLQTQQVNSRYRPLRRWQWPGEEDTESLLQVEQDSVPTRFEPRALTTMVYVASKSCLPSG